MTSDRWQEIERLYHLARQQDPAKREAFLEKACEKDESLRREVGSLLASRSEAEDFIESPAMDVAARAIADDRVKQHSDLAGRTLLHYQIMKQVGSGGMGEVYQAKDLSLGRDVGIKVIPQEFARDPDRIARFKREAKLLASLNHPNIAAIHGLEESGETQFLVLELVEGETLRSLISRGPVAVRKLLDIAVQIADGMAAAHAGGITHRDLKPANIMLSPDGRVKILDFGLARQSSAPAVAGSETLTISRTKPGMIMGTVHYMSPEQAGGKPVDYRSDQFSFGLILYELASGKKAFDKPESVQTLSAILTEEPPPIERSIPGPLRWIIDRCLAKDPADRYDSSRDLYRELRKLRDHLSEASAPQAAATAPRRLKWLIPAITFLVGLGLVLGAWLFFEPSPMPDQSAYRFTPFAFDPGGQEGGSWSPDGKAFAYTGIGFEGNTQVFVRYLDSFAPVQVTHIPEGALFPGKWSADSRRIYFYSSRNPAGTWSVAAVGGDPEPFLSFSVVAPFEAIDVSPDWKAVAALRLGEDGHMGIWIGTPPDWKLKKYSPDPLAANPFFSLSSLLRFAPDGKNILLFFNVPESGRGEEAWLIPYPPDPGNPPRLVLRDMPRYGETASFSWMPDSRHIVLSTQATPDGSTQLWFADVRSGRRQALTSGTSNRVSPAVSPDGQRIIFTEQSTNFDVVSANLDGSPPRVLIATERNETMPAWAAKQPALVYVTDRNGPPEIWLRAAGSDRPVVTARSFPSGTTQWFVAPALSPDADRVVYTRTDRNGAIRLWISAISGGAPTPLTDETADIEYPGSWSPDASWFVYYAMRNGQPAYLMKVRTTGQAHPIVLKANVPGAIIPSWSPAGDWIAHLKELISPDGKTTRPLDDKGSRHYMFSPDGKLLYGIRSTDNRNILFSVDIATGSEKVLGDLGKEFSPSTNLMPGFRYSLAPDGKSFVYGVVKIKSSLWMLEGFEPKTRLLARFIRGWSK
jgi:serine/threonine protein kinase/Tol biopolymer transport system component